MSGGGKVAYINRSDGGVPKLHVDTARITTNGIDSDRHADTKYHGGPERALCLYSIELIEALQLEGHPIHPGSIGENLTLAGVPWEKMIPWLALDIGSVRVLLTSYTTPCRTIRESFADHHISRISHKVYPGWSWLYARVLEEGEISVGDDVVLHT